MDYVGFFETVELGQDGQYKVTVFYSKNDVRYEQEAVADSASAARNKLHDFRAAFKAALSNAKQLTN